MKSTRSILAQVNPQQLIKQVSAIKDKMQHARKAPGTENAAWAALEGAIVGFAAPALLSRAACAIPGLIDFAVNTVFGDDYANTQGACYGVFNLSAQSRVAVVAAGTAVAAGLWGYNQKCKSAKSESVAEVTVTPELSDKRKLTV